MTTYTIPNTLPATDNVPPELKALAHLESACNSIRLRIAGLAPDQIYRGTTNFLSIAEMLALAVEREKSYVAAVTEALAGQTVELIEPEPVELLLDRVFHNDLALFFDIRRHTLDLLRTVSAARWDHLVTVRGQGQMTLRDLAIRLDQHDTMMLNTISTQRRELLKTNGVDELRDSGVAGKLAPNIAQ